MATTSGPESAGVSGAGVLCSKWARESRLDPIGTAGCYSGYLLVEWPLPWPRDIGDDAALASVSQAARAAGVRLQGLVPASSSGSRHVVAYRWPDGAGSRFERSELVVESSEVAAAALAVLGEPPVAGGEDTVDVLVCTHGRRDRCCGSLGTELTQELLAAPALPSDAVRVWRTSHTGGHRFAPTAIVLPAGTAWAFCDKSTLEAIVARRGQLNDLLARYRGCAGLRSPCVQALERAVLAEVGWPLFDMARQGHDLGDDRVELSVESPDGSLSTWEAVVRGEMVPVPECGLPIELATKQEPRWTVEALRRR
jgi:hypothetical protein